MKKLNGYWTVWDTGFGLKIAPSDPVSHPHINMAVQLSAIKSFPFPNGDNWEKKWKETKELAWKECNRLNRQHKKEKTV